MNVIVSGWPGVGQTTLSILLAKTLNFSLLQGSNTFRYIWAELDHENTGQDRIDAEVLQYSWGILYEKYVSWKIMNSDKIVLESDITGFLINDPKKVYSIFLKCDYAIRQERLEKDGRGDDVNVLLKRDKELGKTYFKQFGAKFLDEKEIDRCYTVVLDNSHLNFEEELFQVLDSFAKNKKFESIGKETVLLYLSEGKQGLLSALAENGLIFPLDDIFIEVIKYFKADFEKLPADIKKVILNKISETGA